MNSLQYFGIEKTNLPRHGKAMQWEVGVIKLTANRPSVLANEASIEVENRQSCLTHDGMKGIIASALADTSQVERIETFVLSQENK